VQDADVEPAKLDVARRRRMLMGNMQWAGALLPEYFRRNPVAGLVAARRIFRMFWAWWLASLAVGLALAWRPLALPGAAAAAALLAFSGTCRQLAGAAVVSLLAPLGILRAGTLQRGAWK
jgi:hypothetical protein